MVLVDACNADVQLLLCSPSNNASRLLVGCNVVILPPCNMLSQIQLLRLVCQECLGKTMPIVSVCRSDDGMRAVVRLPKAEVGSTWRRLFRGDSDGVRGMAPPYLLTEGEEEVVVEVRLLIGKQQQLQCDCSAD
jgi:hypothetical protein